MPVVTVPEPGLSEGPLASEVFDVNANNNAVGARLPRNDVPGFNRANGNRIVTLHGWLIGMGDTGSATGGMNPTDPDWHFWFAPDGDHLVSRNFDLHTFIKPSDIMYWGYQKTPDDCAATFAIPAFHCELDGWAERSHPGQGPPYNWKEIASANEKIWWAFNPEIDPATGAAWDFSNGPVYVEITSSIVTDQPHTSSGDSCASIRQGWANGSSLGMGDLDANNQARWTELHSPDYIRRIPQPAGANIESLRGLAVISESTAEVKISQIIWTFPAGTYPADSQPVVEEFVGPECSGALTTGNPTRTGADIQTNVDASGALNVSITAGVTGMELPPVPEPITVYGRFKAAYRLHW